MRRALALAAGAGLVATPVRGQGEPAAPTRVSVVPPDAAIPLHRRPWIRPLASLLVPGTGQVLAHQPRGVVYLATEVWLVARAVALGRDSRRERQHFRDLAYEVARQRFGTERREGPFSYYEEMGKYAESGVYDQSAGPELVPESDTTTFNGSVWRLARETFFENPDSAPATLSAPFRAALDFYRRRAITDPFRWSWRDARLEQDVFRASIRASDEAYQAATNYLGAVLLNHLVSAVDAFIAVRVGRNGILPRVQPGAAARSMQLLWHAEF
ncbi:MAG: hypothetical protein AAB409_02980 [Gemmatimonadota bacterium]